MPPLSRAPEEESRKPRDRGRKSPKPTQPQPPKAQRPQLLLTTDLACEVSIDFKKAVTLKAGGHATIDVEPGEHLVTAVTPRGRGEDGHPGGRARRQARGPEGEGAGDATALKPRRTADAAPR
jgi:hypothetical protein